MAKLSVFSFCSSSEEGEVFMFEKSQAQAAADLQLTSALNRLITSSLQDSSYLDHISQAMPFLYAGLI